MEKTYQPQQFEDKIYQLWQKRDCFTAKIDKKKKPFSIIMPPPNANAKLHIGHALFITLEDILARYHRMKGDAVLWLPGADHAGILTQVVFERYLEKQGKTRYDLGREKFYKQCLAFTQKNQKLMFQQMEKLGASCDWTRMRFTLDQDISETVAETFVRLYNDGLVYRAERMINWCPRCQTALSDLEVEHIEQKDPLYFLKYGPFTLATVRPETKFGDTAVAVHPQDKRYQKWIGREIEVKGLIGKFKLKVIADKVVDPKFGSGVIKVTPAHDPVDFEIGQRHQLSIRTVIDFNGKLNEKTGPYVGLRIKRARKIIVADLVKKGLLVKTKSDYQHRVAICERCQTLIEPMISLQYFIKTKPLAKAAIEAVKKDKIKILPARFKKTYCQWMNNIRDWCVSRQIWWGQPLPIWYCGTKGLSDLQKSMHPELIKNKQPGCGSTMINVIRPKRCPDCGSSNLSQDPDTFDTWFSSAQWPYTTLGFKWHGKHRQDFQYFYPTTVMETGYEILFFWVARMIMLGLYTTGKIPFQTVYLHGLVRDALGEKMSKSKGNVVNPSDMIEKYGADALRLSLIWGIAPGNDSNIGEEKIRAMRNFTNKIWNISRFVLIHKTKLKIKNEKLKITVKNLKLKEDKKLINKLNKLINNITKNMESFRFSPAAEELYHFTWHEFADKYIESFKSRSDNSESLCTLHFALLTLLKLLHPFMPFITEAVWQKFNPKSSKLLINQPWPKND